jgi:hypothetical protein
LNTYYNQIRFRNFTWVDNHKIWVILLFLYNSKEYLCESIALKTYVTSTLLLASLIFVFVGFLYKITQTGEYQVPWQNLIFSANNYSTRLNLGYLELVNSYLFMILWPTRFVLYTALIVINACYSCLVSQANHWNKCPCSNNNCCVLWLFGKCNQVRVLVAAGFGKPWSSSMICSNGNKIMPHQFDHLANGIPSSINRVTFKCKKIFIFSWSCDFSFICTMTLLCLCCHFQLNFKCRTFSIELKLPILFSPIVTYM